MRGLFIPDITAEMFRNGCLESIEALMAEGEIYDVDYQQPCEDCISREALINEMKLGYFNKDLQEGKNDPCVIDAMIDWAIRTVKRQPSVTPTRPKGKWSRPSVVAMPYSFAYECPICRQWGNIQTFKPNYCPNCGAKMAESEE